jgi:DNA-binding NarL/FixJ family response regulator
VRRLGRPEELAEAAPGADVLVIDLTADAAERVEAVRALEPGEAPAPPVLGFYSHVEQDVRRLADDAGFDLVVPRSRMAREMAPLVERLSAEAGG